MLTCGLYEGLVGGKEAQPHHVSIPSQIASLSSCARHPAQLWRGEKSASVRSGPLKDQAALLLSLVGECRLPIPIFLHPLPQAQTSPRTQVINWVSS